jgi:hypothetical protein
MVTKYLSELIWSGSPIILFFNDSNFVITSQFIDFFSIGNNIAATDGTKLAQVGDDFEDENWEYIYNNPKSTRENDNSDRDPGGESKNGRWYEGMKRGQPDVIKRVETPANGLPGSKGSLLLRSLWTGIPGRASYRMQQDDFIGDVTSRIGGISPSRSPNVVVRVFLPPVKEWERRSGPHFAFRIALETTVMKPNKSGWRSSGTRRENETFWPGMFIELNPKGQGQEQDSAHFRFRANEYGGDFQGPQITTTGWWTLGLSLTPDSLVHYYAKPGIENLTKADYVTSQHPYSFRCDQFSTFFFNVCNGDDGRTWSTAFVIDDPTVYVVR